MRPIGDTMNRPVLDRIDIAIFDVPLEIRFIADQMFPKAPLPNLALTSFTLETGSGSLLRDGSCKA